MVGDPGRAEFISSTFLRDLEVEHEHRRLLTLAASSQITIIHRLQLARHGGHLIGNGQPSCNLLRYFQRYRIAFGGIATFIMTEY